MKKKNYTLIEMLCCIGILAVLMNAAMLLFVDGTRICRDAIKNAELNQDIILLRKKWRAFIKECPGDFKIRDGILRSGGNSAKTENGKLILCGANGIKELVFPQNTGFEFRMEKFDSFLDCVVLTVSSDKNLKSRIVACYEKKTK